jgi:triacylglycerol lipase
VKDDIALRARKPGTEVVPRSGLPVVEARRKERDVAPKIEPDRSKMHRTLQGPETGRLDADSRMRESERTGGTSEASLQGRVSADFELTTKRVLARGTAIDKTGLGELLTAIDALDPAAQKEAIAAIEKARPALAEALGLFKAAGDHEQNDASRRQRISGALEYLAINTDAKVEIAGPVSNVLKAASRYGASLGVDAVRREGHGIVAVIGGEKVELLRFDPKLSHAELLREIGRALNLHRFGSKTVIPPTRIPFIESSAGYAAEQAYWSAQLSQLAYCDPKLAEKQARAWGFTKFEWIDDPKSDTQVMVVANDRLSVVAFRGSSSVEDFKNDALIAKTEAHGGGVHSGFHRALSSTWPAIDRALEKIGGDKPVLFTGHSLGGGLATLAASAHAERGGRVEGVYLYGCPRVGDARFVAAYNARLGDKTFLHVNDEDIVTRLPPGLFGYAEVGNEKRVFDDSGALHLEPIPKGDPSRDLERSVSPAERERALRDMDAGIEAVRLAERRSTSLHPESPQAGARSGLLSLEPVEDHGSEHYVRLTGRRALDAVST